MTDSSTKGKCLKIYLCHFAFENLLRKINHKTKCSWLKWDKKRTEQLWGQRWIGTHAEVCIRVDACVATFADSSWTLHLFVKRLFVLWCHWWSELSLNRNKGGVIWLRSLGSCPGYVNAACHGLHYIDNHTQLLQNLGRARDLIQYWGQMTAKLGWFKMLIYISLEKLLNLKKATCKCCQAYANSVTNLIFIASLFSFWV